jgi:hypothetical protein
MMNSLREFCEHDEGYLESSWRIVVWRMMDWITSVDDGGCMHGVPLCIILSSVLKFGCPSFMQVKESLIQAIQRKRTVAFIYPVGVNAYP